MTVDTTQQMTTYMRHASPGEPASGFGISPSASGHRQIGTCYVDCQLGSGQTPGNKIDKDKAVQMAQTSYHVVLRGRLEVYAVLLYYT